ncbi:protein phosphatase 1E-like [Homalodisca vitripennis]|uniref:protein phosphatase 1E-like n=1 Tax=Homalodisca vitripennis TaxID=197043 RepID=UPI001EEB8374|nr:protein phosphatase 1E-like [Homalodisca vitripennis]
MASRLAKNKPKNKAELKFMLATDMAEYQEGRLWWDVCARYQDNAELSSLPPPHPHPPTSSCAVKNSRRSMEDRHVVIHDFHTLFNIKDYGPASYYGVFDGHNGIDAAVYSVSHLHQYLAESQHYPSQPLLAMREACIRTDDLFTSKADKENLHGGTTAVYALLRPKEQKLYVGWLGDSLAVLVRRGVPYQIVQAHKPDRSDERDRIEKLGGTILYWGAWRVNGQLAVSRAIGDVEYKPYVSAKPDVEEITLDGTEDFLIVGCDGLWDFVTEQEATNLVYNHLQENAGQC